MRSRFVVARVAARLAVTFVRRRARDRTERVQHLVRGHRRRRDAGARAVVHDRRAEAARVASALTAHVPVGGGAVVVDDVLRGRRAQARLVERGDDPGEAPLKRRKLRARLRRAHGRDVELGAARERRDVVPRCPRRILASPPTVDLLRVRLHHAREAREVVGAVRRDHVHPVDRIARDAVRRAVGLRTRAAPGRLRDGPRRRLTRREVLGGDVPNGRRSRDRARARREDRRRERDDDCQDADHGVVTETRTRPSAPACVTRTKSERRPQIELSRRLTRCPTH